MNRTILHVDMNSYYYSVEAMRNPELRGKAVIVGGSAEEHHGIVLAKSELAKRAGIKTGMVIWEAQLLCKDLIIVRPNYDQYLKYSRLARAIYARYTDLVEPFGMDECWLDVTGSRRLFGDGPTIAEDIRETVKRELGLTVSVGVSFCKSLAKLGSDMRKPDAVTVISRDDLQTKAWPAPVSDLLYCGPATTAKLARYGIKTIGALAQADSELIRRTLGVNGLYLQSCAQGNEKTPVAEIGYVAPIKSVGHGITCVSDLRNAEEVNKVILALSQDIGHRLRINGLLAGAVHVYVRGHNLAYSHTWDNLDYGTQLPCELAKAAFDIFRRCYDWRQPVRAITIQAGKLTPVAAPQQTTLFMDAAKHGKLSKLQDTIESVRSRFGKAALTYASLLGDIKMPDDGRDMVQMPGLMYR